MNNFKKTNIDFPVEYSVEYNKNRTIYTISTTEESEKIINQSIVSQGNSFEEAERGFWILLGDMFQYHQKRSSELDKWKPLQIGPAGFGGKWITIFGLYFNFRYGEEMKYGWYVPFTKLNIMFVNYWRK